MMSIRKTGKKTKGRQRQKGSYGPPRPLRTLLFVLYIADTCVSPALNRLLIGSGGWLRAHTQHPAHRGGTFPQFWYATPPPPIPPLSCQGAIATGHTYGGAKGARKFPLPTWHPFVPKQRSMDGRHPPLPTWHPSLPRHWRLGLGSESAKILVDATYGCEGQPHKI